MNPQTDASTNSRSQALVSVIIRTKDRREMLTEALASVAAQRYRPIEIVVVNDGGEDVSDLLDRFGETQIAIRQLRHMRSKGRSAAANAGLDAATGRYCIFLDDDDWFEPDHVEALVHCLEANPDARVAYAGVRFTTEPGAEDIRIFNHPFDAARLLWGNFIPVHAALFHRSLIEEGCRIDESLRVYEDWDFWLQLAQHTRFVHVDQISAGYRSGGASGAGPASGTDAVRQARETIYDKWKARWSGADINAAFEWGVERPAYVDLTTHAKALQAWIDVRVEEDALRIRTLESELNDLRKRYDELSIEERRQRDELHRVLTSISWRIGKPLRWARQQSFRLATTMKVTGKLAREPARILPTVRRVKDAWREGGVSAGWSTLKLIATEPDQNKVFQRWRRSLTAEMRRALSASAQQLPSHPVISILMPVYNTPRTWLVEAIDSVRAQCYEHWQLCIVDDGSTEPHVRRILESAAAQDSRIAVSFAPHLGNISNVTNRALSMAQGDYVVLMDHDDLLEPQALLRLAESIGAESPDMIYSDEVLVGRNGRDVVHHLFRPQFSLELLRAHPYIVHLLCFRTEQLRAIGGLDETMSISQDYDLVLRFVERARRIVHIPEVLYRWRQHGGSTGHTRAEAVMEASRNALARHLERCGEHATVENGAQFNFFRIRYALQPGSRVAIVIPTKNHGALVRQCIESIARTVNDVDYDIVVVDHASDDLASIEYFESLRNRHTVLRCDGPFNFSVINNWAISQLPPGHHTHYLLCNNDIEAIEEGWLGRMMAFGQKADVGIVGAHLLYTDRLTIQHAGVCVGMYGAAEHYGKFMRYVLPDGSRDPGYLGALITDREMSAVTAACALVRRDAYEAVNGLDPALAVGFGDVDFCLRIREKGYRIVFCPDAILVHHESYSRGKSTHDPHPEDSQRFRARWRDFLEAGDPYYNPNLSDQNTFWHLAEPMVFKEHVGRRIVDKPVPGRIASSG